MESLVKKLDLLEERVLLLVQKAEYLVRENSLLMEENVKLKEESEKYKSGKIRPLEEDVQSAKIARQVETTFRDQISRELDKYIEEVDRCIELVNAM